LVLLSCVEEFVFGGLPFLLFPNLVIFWIVRSVWAVAHLGNDQVRRMFRQNKPEFAVNMIVLVLMVPGYVYLWYFGLWPIAIFSHSAGNLFSYANLHRRIEKNGFRDFWENIHKT